MNLSEIFHFWELKWLAYETETVCHRFNIFTRIFTRPTMVKMKRKFEQKGLKIQRRDSAKTVWSGLPVSLSLFNHFFSNSFFEKRFIWYEIRMKMDKKVTETTNSEHSRRIGPAVHRCASARARPTSTPVRRNGANRSQPTPRLNGAPRASRNSRRRRPETKRRRRRPPHRPRRRRRRRDATRCKRLCRRAQCCWTGVGRSASPAAT